jgi:integrase
MSVYKRFNGKKLKSSKDPNWSKATWYMWKRVNGQVVHKRLSEAVTKEDAERAERSIIGDIFNKRYGILDRSTPLAKFARSTYQKYVTQKNVNKKAKLTDIDTFVKFFGERKLLIEITPQDCRDLQDKLLHTPTVRGTPRSPSTVNRTMTSLSKLFALAREERLIDENPMEYVVSFDEPPPRLRRLTPIQKESFWNEVTRDPFLFNIVMLGVNMPLRRGQILAISRESVDLEERKLLIIRSKGRDPRFVPINDAAAHILAAMCEGVESGPLITYKGQPIKDFRTRWGKMLVRAKINKPGGTREENFHFHDLRTEFASSLINKNVSPEVVRQLFAHSSMQITQGYMSDEFDTLSAAVNRLDGGILDSEVIQ